MDWQSITVAVAVYLLLSRDSWQSAFIPFVGGLALNQAAEYSLSFGMAFDDQVQNLYAEEWLMDYTMPFVQAVVDVTGEDLNALLAQGLYEGWSIPQTSGHLTELFTQYMTGDLTPEAFAWFAARMPAYRAELIARTETIRASAKGAEELFAAWGVEQKQWWAALDERTCPWCGRLHGKIIGTRDKFFGLGERFNVEIGTADNLRTVGLNFTYEDVTGPPLHPGCRCTLLPWKSSWAGLGVT